MRRWVWIAVLGVALPAVGQERMSVEQLEGLLAQARSMADADLAGRLSDLQLTERLSTTRLMRMKADLPGAKSNRALTGLADRSAFLALPPSETPTISAPDLPEQRRIMGLAATYVSNAIPQLPKFYATRTITHFEGSPGRTSDEASNEVGAIHALRISRATVLYRDGEEVIEPGPTMVADKNHSRDRGLKTWGIFGPILGLVLLDAAENKLVWSHWEQDSKGPVAVFGYAVPKAKSHYEVRYCCVASTYGLESNSFQEMSGYRGEISVDPSSGTILRLTLQAELEPGDPISRAAVAVEYAPVELGGTTHVCPARSISIAVAKTLRQLKDPSGRSYPAMGPQQMLLNHADFDQYHLFHSESRVLSTDEARAAKAAPDATLPTAAPVNVQPADEELADTLPATPAANGGITDMGSGSAATPNGEAPEISTAVATALPESAAHPADQPAESRAQGYVLRLNARLVDVNVVALDKKGRPITNLRREDFEVSDNGTKQDIRSFNQADAGIGPPPETPSAQGQKEFSNHKAQAAVDDRNTLVLLIDGSNLSYPDFANARQQVIRFLQTLPPDERIALYAMRYHSYQILEEPTTDHTMLEAKLAKWAPSGQDVANAQDEEQRNRQQIEYVHSPEDMLSVNGNFTLDTGSQQEALDPKLRELGSRPAPNSLSLLVDVARHLAAIPGHKSLIWITSDNALADWTKTSVTIDKSSKFIEPVALRTQEAMNNAQVSVYPLDASHLEGAVISASLGNRNVELTPTFQRGPDAPALAQATEQAMEGPEATSTQDMNPYIQNHYYGSSGRLAAQMQQDMHPIQGVFREVAEATGGRALRRSNDMVGQMDGVAADGRATYLLGFTPSAPADGKYHLITVKLVNHRDAVLRYRTGYLYDIEPTTLKDRFKRAIWEAADAREIEVSTKPIADAEGEALRVTVAGSDLALAQQSSLWTGQLNIFLVQRDDVGQHAKVSGQSVGLRLKPATYQRAINEGLTFDERIESKPGSGSLRVVVVDVNSGRIGSVTVPNMALAIP
jgi:VWFA-related protein